MRKGLYRLQLKDLGECARVHPSAGDAAPYLDRETYELMNFEPPYHSLPPREEYEVRIPRAIRAKRRYEDVWRI